MLVRRLSLRRKDDYTEYVPESSAEHPRLFRTVSNIYFQDSPSISHSLIHAFVQRQLDQTRASYRPNAVFGIEQENKHKQGYQERVTHRSMVRALAAHPKNAASISFPALTMLLISVTNSNAFLWLLWPVVHARKTSTRIN